MINFIQGGARLPYTNSGSLLASGAVVAINAGGALGGVNLGVAVDTIAATTGTGVLQICGVFSLPKTAGEAYVFGQNLYWTGTAITAASTGNTWAGTCADTAGDVSANTTVGVLLNGLPYAG